MNPRAGMALFAETGSLIARPQQIVPVLIVPATVLWVPVAPIPGYAMDYFGRVAAVDTEIETFMRSVQIRDERTGEMRPYSAPDVGPEEAALRFMNDRYFEPRPDVGQTWRNEPGIAPPLTLDAVRQTLENLGPMPPGTIVREAARRRPVRNLFAERIIAIADEWLAAHQEAERPRAAGIPNLGQHTPADDDLVATLLDFAREGDADGFRALAEMRGVPSAEIPAMWDGTVKRLGKAKPA